MTHGDGATRNTVFFAGNETTEFYVELLGLADPEAASTSPRAQALKRTLERGGGAHSIMLSTEDLAAAPRPRRAPRRLRRDHRHPRGRLRHRDGPAPGRRIARGVPFGIIAYAERLDVRRARHRDAGLFANPLGLRRMDHLAAVVHDIEGATRVWDSVLGVPVFGQCVARAWSSSR
ncbi:MAG: VOC family protein [Dehalococcoidia bacterium]